MRTGLRYGLLGSSLALRVYLGAVFLAACWYKIADPGAFALSIATYDILPAAWVHPLALLLPWIELVIGLTLIAGFWTRASALAIAGMMILFIAALAIALANDLQLSCGCFASAEAGDEINAGTLVRDLLWLSGALFVLLVDDGRLGLDGWFQRRKRSRAAR